VAGRIYFSLSCDRYHYIYFIRVCVLLPADIPDILICGNCKDLFSNLTDMIEHKKKYCKLRFTCKCGPSPSTGGGRQHQTPAATAAKAGEIGDPAVQMTKRGDIILLLGNLIEYDIRRSIIDSAAKKRRLLFNRERRF
jgi:hypothetical protein